MTKNIESFTKYNVRLGDINKIQNIMERNQRSIQNIKESKMYNKQSYSLKEIMDNGVFNDSYFDDPQVRARFQTWLNERWHAKD